MRFFLNKASLTLASKLALQFFGALSTSLLKLGNLKTSSQHLQTPLQPFAYIMQYNLFPGDAYWAKIWNILKQCLLRSETVGGSRF